MKKSLLLFTQIVFIFPILAQETEPDANYFNIAREGFGTHSSYDMGLGFVNAKALTEGTAYYFDNWDTKGTVFIKEKGMVKLERVNINLYDNTLEALYNEGSVFTFNSDNIIKIAINDKVFRFFELYKEQRILELFFNDIISIYKYNNVSYHKASKDVMRNRTTNKFIKSEKYFLYRDGQLTEMKLSKNAFSELLQSEKHSEDAIKDYIIDNRLDLDKEADLVRALKFVSR